MKQNREIWRDIPDYEGYYEASNLGRIRSLDRWVIYKNGRKQFYKGRIMEGSDNNGYKILALSRENKQETFYVHQLVTMCFLNHTPNGHSLVIDHIDGDKANNNMDNLRIVTQRDNTSTCHRSDRNSLSSEYVGVHRFENKWRASINYNKTQIHLGLFNNEEDASDTYQKALGKINNNTFNPDKFKPSFTSNFKGVSYQKASQKWVANPTINGRRIYLGYHSTEEEAHQAILEFEAIQPIVNNS